MSHRSYLGAGNALYNILSTYTGTQQLARNFSFSKQLRKNTHIKFKFPDSDKNTPMNQHLIPSLTKPQIPSLWMMMHSGKLKRVNFKPGDVFIIKRFYSSSYSNLSSSQTARNLYNVLGVSPNANASEIKSAFYKLSKAYHPDINKTDEAVTRFAEILAAYEILGNSTKKRMYDRGTMTHPRFGVSPHRNSFHGRETGGDNERRKRPMKPGGVGERPEGSGPSREFTNAAGRPAFKFDSDFRDYYSTSMNNRLFTKKESEHFMKRHHEDERARRFRGIGTGIVVFLFLGLVFISKQINFRKK